jgi:hypothetical protein
MTETHLNTFNKGMVKDVSDSLKESSTYEDALDVRLNAYEGATDHIITNVRGNSHFTTIPDVPAIFTFEMEGTSFIPSWTYSPGIELSNGQIIYGNTIIGSGSVNAFFDQLEECFQNSPQFQSLDLRTARIGSRLRIWSPTSDIVDIDTSTLVQNTDLVLSIQPFQGMQKVIGWHLIDDIIYLFTTNDNSSTGSYGSIWKLSYDPFVMVPTVTLIYSDMLNLTQRNLIANPGGIEGIRENSIIERLYWTDRLNPLRSINVKDPQVMATRPEDLDLRLTSSLKKPALKSIQNGGQLVTGVYQVAYCLRNSQGAMTSYSHTSNSIDILEDSIFGGYTKYTGNDNSIITGKSFTVFIDDIDTTYQYLDLVVLRKESPNTTALIGKIVDIPVTQDTITFTVTGNEPQVVITESDFNAILVFFEKCHALAQKDNILFAANTVERKFDVEFDARAYRFDQNQFCELQNEQGVSTTYNASQLLQSFGIPETDDAINPDQSNWKFQSDGVTIGGEGPHIRYGFTMESIVADSKTTPYDISHHTFPWKLPWNNGGQNYLGLNDGVTYNVGGFYSDYKSPYTKHLFMGYRRGETYRFSWVPVKDGVEGYAKWIADIKMPDIYEHPTDPNQIFKILEDINGVWQMNVLGVKFDVTLPPSVASKIDGFRIKRVKVNEEDRTILGQGIVHLVRSSTIGGVTTYHPVTHYDSSSGPSGKTFGLNGNGSDIWLTGNPSITFPFGNQQSTTEKSFDLVTFHSPDMLFRQVTDYRSGDKLRVVAGLLPAAITNGNNGPIVQGGGSNTPLMMGIKLYRQAPLNWHLAWYGNHNPNSSFSPNTLINIEETAFCPMGGQVNIASLTYKNEAKEDPNYNAPLCYGTDTMVLKLNSGFYKVQTNSVYGGQLPFSLTRSRQGSYLNYLGATNDCPDKILANYVRPNLAQYGGRGYSARSRNVYISTGCNIVTEGQTTFTNIRVFGGDTFINIFDTLKTLRNFAISANTSDVLNQHATALWYPCENFVNTDLREGYTINGNHGPLGYLYGDATFIPSPDDYPLDYGEDFKYNYLFSEHMDTQRSYPLPASITEVYEHPFRIWASKIKVYGERSDSWRQFDNDTYIDIQGDLGEIRQIINRSNQILAFQRNGVGVASVNERSILNDNSGSGIIIGKSGVLPRYDYISRNVGSRHQFSFAVSPTGIIFFDANTSTFYRHTGEGLSDISSGKIGSWLFANTRGQLQNNDSPVLLGSEYVGMTCTYDSVNGEFLITVFERIGRDPVVYTLAYDDTKDIWVSFRSHTPIMYINDRRSLISPDRNSSPSKLYMHDTGDRGVFYDDPPSTSHVTITVNKDPFIVKIFDNIRWFTEVFDTNGVEISSETFSGLEVANTYQTTGNRTVFSRLMREWKHAIIYAASTKDRIRSHYVKQKFKFLNNNNKEIRLHYVMNLFRKILR